MSQVPHTSVTPPPVDLNTIRPNSEFDAGLNASTAWTEWQRNSSYQADSVSDDEKEQVLKGRHARALYDFEGRADFRELTVKAGDEIEVLKETLPDGWSLVSVAGEAGLLPQSYYTFTTEFATGPSLHTKEDSVDTIGAGGSTPRPTTPPPLADQRTGEWTYGLPNFRQSLLGGKSINRFSSFVTTGAEEWVLNGTNTHVIPTPPQPQITRETSHESDDEDAQVEEDRHFVETGPVWKSKLPEFQILVHSPSKRTSTLAGSYTVYSITSIFTPSFEERHQEGIDGPDEPSPRRMTVHRRFSHFVFLHTALIRRLPGIALPPLPEKQYSGRFSDSFVEARRGDLERYLNRLIRHPIARYAEVVTFFLSCDNEIEWTKKAPHHLSLPPAGPQFYARIYHPAFNLDLEDATDVVDRFNRHLKAVTKGVQGLRGIFGPMRQARMGMAKYHRILSYSILSLITSTPLASAPPPTALDEEEEEDLSRKGLMNSEGAWCWREHCDECLKLSKAMQRTAETFQAVADLQEDNARRTLLNSHEGLKGVAHPSMLYAPVVETHRATLSRYKTALTDNSPHEEVAARCETVLNTTMAEFETYHTQKQQDFEKISLDILNGEIEMYEGILSKLKAARDTFYSPQWEELSAANSGPKQPSMFERELTDSERLELVTSDRQLQEPCPHVWDSTPMRPVSVAIQEGVGILFGSSSVSNLYGRGSVFGRFW